MKYSFASLGQFVKESWYTPAIILLFLAHVLPVLLLWPSSTSCLFPYVDGLNGNLVSGFLGGVLFLVIAIRLGQKNDRMLEQSNLILREQKRLKDVDDDIKKFEDIMFNQTHYDFSFPELGTNEKGNFLIYTLEPIRDENNKPVQKKGQIVSYYVVKVRRKRPREVAGKEELYEKSPIRENEHYFALFLNGAWHIGQEGFSGKWYEIRFFGKSGGIEHGISANKFVGKDSSRDCRLIEDLVIDEKSGLDVDGYSGFTSHKVFSSNDGNHFLQIGDSPLKHIYLCNSSEQRDSYQLIIEDIRGYYHGDGLKNIRTVLEKCIERNCLTVKKVNYWEISR